MPCHSEMRGGIKSHNKHQISNLTYSTFKNPPDPPPRAPAADGTDQVLGAVQLVGGGGTACDQGLEHAAHHHRLHALGQRLAIPRREVVPEARLVWAEAGGAYHYTHGERRLVSRIHPALNRVQPVLIRVHPVLHRIHPV